MPRLSGRLVVWASIAVAAVLTVGVSASAAQPSSARQGHAAGKCWTAAQVKTASAPHDVIPIYCVPKQIPNYLLAFINPDLSNPYFKAWQDGMKAAAKLYKVRFIDADAQNKYDTETSLYQTLNAQHPDAVGAHPGNDVIAQEAVANHQPFTTIDGFGGTTAAATTGGIGIPDSKAGALAASSLAPYIKAKLAGPWKGKQLYFLGLGVPGCAPCQIRPKVALANLKKQFTFAGSAFTPQYADPNFGQKWMTDQMTAHPDGRFVIVPLNDEGLIGVLQALKDAGKLNNAVAVTMGGDSTGLGFFKTYPQTVRVAIDFNPFSEGWNWVVASIARLQYPHGGGHYSQYKLGPAITNGKP
jgi:ABC-type sugar transport system substrate-binding protein